MKTDKELWIELLEAYISVHAARRKFIEVDQELEGRVNLVAWVRGKL